MLLNDRTYQRLEFTTVFRCENSDRRQKSEGLTSTGTRGAALRSQSYVAARRQPVLGFCKNVLVARFFLRHSYGAAKGKPIERWGRKATGLRAHIAYDSGVASDDFTCCFWAGIFALSTVCSIHRIWYSVVRVNGTHVCT